MTSTVCHRFVQNAWKKERCSNCFKAKEEHVTLKREAPVSRRPLTTLSTSKSRSIMKTTTTTTRKRAVSFKPDLTQIIGYGGDEWSDNEDSDAAEDGSPETSEDDVHASEDDDKDLEKLTKSNTELNANISSTTPPPSATSTTDRRRTFTQLMLGQPQRDADGKKQTLLVSVTPFGQDDCDRTPMRKFTNKSVSHIPIAKNKEIFTESRPKVILTSYSKNRDSPELLKSADGKNTRRELTENAASKTDATDKKSEKISTNCDSVTENHSAASEEKKSEQVKSLTNTRENCVVGDEKKVLEKSVGAGDFQQVVETRNELTVLKKVDLSVTTFEECINKELVLEESRGEEIVKSELKVKLSNSSPQNNPSTNLDLNLPVQIQEKDSPESSSEESADSLGPAPAESREQAGEPDGRADPDVPCEPPALPRSPPPSLLLASPPPRASFLHGTADKPKVPSKPEKSPLAPKSQSQDLATSLPATGGGQPPLPPQQPHPQPHPQQLSQPSPITDPSKLPNKRRAPNPPACPDETSDHFPGQNLQNLPELPMIRSVSVPQPESNPPVQSGEKLILTGENLIIPGDNLTTSEPIVPRRILSVSNDCLMAEKVDEKRPKDKTRTRFSLKKFLRVGGGSGGKSAEKIRMEECKEKSSPQVKPRLVIVHPLELNGSGVEVVAPPGGGEEAQATPPRGLPPAPPPRNFSEKRLEEPKPPPKSEEMLRKQRQLTTSPVTPAGIAFKASSGVDNVYANLGEVRSGLAPSKPQRTASMREREAALLEQQQQQHLQQQQQHLQQQQQHLQQLARRKQQLQLQLQLHTSEHVYERVSPPRRHSEEASGKESLQNLPPKLKMGGGYSSSEPDLEIYSPCGSYYGSECEISEGCSRPCRLRSRKGRSIVHRNLEDNYGAVVVANHEALAQVLEHLHTTATVPSPLRGLQTAPMLRWGDFALVDSPGAAAPISVGRRVFHHALWGAHHVTLAVSTDQASMHKHHTTGLGLGAFTLVPVTEFNDLVPKKYLPGAFGADSDLVQASVAVLPWMQVDTIQTIGSALKSKNGEIDTTRDACFILLQFVNCLKGLQAQGIEEVPLSLSNFILCHDIDKDAHHRLCLLQRLSEEVFRPEESEQLGSLCQCATVALNELFPPTKLATLIRTLLKKESAMSLSQVKSIMEFSLWGPSDVALGVPIKDRELALQRWLDLERATVLHGLVGTRVQLSVLEECHLLFLVRSSAKMMCEASLLLENNSV